MPFIAKIKGIEYRSDDLTGAELEIIEEVTKTGWAFLNPLSRIADAKAIIACLLVRAGATEDEAIAEAAKLSAGTLDKVFRIVPASDDPDPFVDGDPVPAVAPE